MLFPGRYLEEKKRKKGVFGKKQESPCKKLFFLLLYFSRCFAVELLKEGGAIMAKCAICEKAVHFGNQVSHSHRRSNKMWKANVKSVRVKVDGGTKKMYVCTSCLRSGKVERAVSGVAE